MKFERCCKGRTQTTGNVCARTLLVLALSLVLVFGGCANQLSDDSIKTLAQAWPEYRPPMAGSKDGSVESIGVSDNSSSDLPQSRTRLAASMGTMHRVSDAPVVPQVSRPVVAPVQSIETWDLEETAIDSLGRIGAPAVPGLIAALEGPDRSKRLRAARVIARIGPDAGQAVPILVQILNDNDPELRKAAARALGQIGPAAEAAVEPLLELIQ